MIISFNFLRSKHYVDKISSRNSILYKFHKIYLESFVSIYHLCNLFGIIYKSIFYNLSVTMNWFIIKDHQHYSEVTLSQNALGSLVSLYSQYWQHLKPLLVFSYSNTSVAVFPWYHFPFRILDDIIKIKWKSWSDG